ncbi:MAG: tetratricopeptide repeat protein [Fimbriimonadaceae bacterium]|nr:tetratricopeptide repeat protein [Fimbriimonadaceae bacterium]
MELPFRQIMDLFDLPGSDTPGEEVAERVGRDAEQSKRFGRESMDAGQYQAAVEHFKRAVSQGATDEGTRMDLAGAMETADMLPEAYYQYLKAKDKASSGELTVALSAMYRRYGRLRDAVATLEESAREHPEDAYVQFRLADALRTNGYRKAALDAVQGAIAAAPDDAFYHYWAADLAYELKEFDQAAKSAQAAIELSPGDDHVLVLAGLALWGTDKRPEALRAVRLACDLDPDKPAYHGVLERLLRAAGHSEEADAELAKVGEMDAYDADTLARLLAPLGMA